MYPYKAVEQNAKIIRRRLILSHMLTFGVRILLSPLTLIYALVIRLWSLPFRLHDMWVRAKNPFLCADALSRYLDEGDVSVTFWDLYCYFRHNLRSVGDSLFNAYYVRLSERAFSGKETRAELQDLPEHPAGWYKYRGELGLRRGLLFWVRVVEFFACHVLSLPRRTAESVRRFSHAMENSKNAFGSAARYLRRRGEVLLPLFACVLVGTLIGFRLSAPLVVAVSVEGKTLGYVESRQALSEAIAETESSVSEALGVTFKFPQNISYSVSREKGAEYLSKTELIDALSEYTGDYVRVGYALYVDGTLAAASENEGKLRALLDDALARARENSGNESLALLNDARILYQNCPVDAFLSDEELVALLQPMSSSGGTMVDITAYRPENIPVSNALADGQAYCYTLSYGEEEEHKETVSLVYGIGRVEEEVEALAYNTTYRESDTIYEGAQYVHQRGVMGEKLISYTVYYSGETEYSREVLSEATLREPIDQIVLIGTKPLPSTGEGTQGGTSQRVFIKPVYGEIYSYFGLRDFDDDGVLDSGHSGIDIPAPKGTPLYASGSGVVTEAGDTGNAYGIVVEILHENGLRTYYSHLDSVTVKVGQAVSQNQMIGTVGTTGRVTGPHVHFEVRLPGGRQVNPVDYLIGV